MKFRRKLKHTSLSRFVNSMTYNLNTFSGRQRYNHQPFPLNIVRIVQCAYVCVVLLDQRMNKFLLVYNSFSSNGLPIKAFAFFYFLYTCVRVSICVGVCTLQSFFFHSLTFHHLSSTLCSFVSLFLSHCFCLSLSCFR